MSENLNPCPASWRGAQRIPGGTTMTDSGGEPECIVLTLLMTD